MTFAKTTQTEKDRIYHSGRRFLDESGRVYSLYDLFLTYEENKEEIYFDSGACNFWEYLVNCTSDNGSLTELRKREFDMPHIETAIYLAHENLNRIFPNLVKNLTFMHADAAGYWFTLELVNDDRRQTYCVRPSDILKEGN